MKTRKTKLEAVEGAHRMTMNRCDALERKLLDVRRVLTANRASCKTDGDVAGQLWDDLDEVLRRVDLGGLF